MNYVPRSTLAKFSVQTKTTFLVSKGEKVYNFKDDGTRISERYYPRPLLNRWTSLTSNPTVPERHKKFCIEAVTVIDEDIYSVVDLTDPRDYMVFRRHREVWKYHLESDSWQSILHFPTDQFYGSCVVPVNKSAHCMGGINADWGCVAITQAARLDTLETKWERKADMQQARYNAFGVTGHGSIFVVGGRGDCGVKLPPGKCFEMYNIEANEWHLIASPSLPWRAHLLSHGTKLYVVGGDNYIQDMCIDCYDIERNEWVKKPFPQEACFRYGRPNSSKCLHLPACLARLPKRTLDTLRPLAV